MDNRYPSAGYRFHPSDEELIVDYLMKKVRGGTLAQKWNHIVECDLYGEKSPWDLFQEYHHIITNYIKTGHLYIFTVLKKTSSKGGKRNSRVAGEGKWHGNTAGKPIYDKYQNKIGFKRQFKFQYMNKNHGEWIMHEYSLGEQEPMVLCDIFKKKKKGEDDDDDGLVDEQEVDNNIVVLDEYDAFMDQQEVDNKCLIEYDRGLERAVDLVPEVGNNNIVDTDAFNYPAYFGDAEKCCFSLEYCLYSN